ncbi:hypothetical protein [Lewinella sp. IMCC34183]|uniref:hypothetical protein n=1 Tax=Lewinella sp. IMCC34183 TaxID=2248762 RepID=UPI000E239C94|nr:hypothetical protein [Lewinella sp. IMCC34183]
MYLFTSQPDSATHYYQEVLNRSRVFNYKYYGEAVYYLMTNARAHGTFGYARDLVRSGMVASGCCPDDRLTTDELCLESSGCIYSLSALADLHLEEYTASRDPENLATAASLSDLALQSYVASFPSLREEAALNQLLVISQRLLDVVLEVAVAGAANTPGPTAPVHP